MKPQNTPRTGQSDGAIPSDASAERSGGMAGTTDAAQRLHRSDPNQHSRDAQTARNYISGATLRTPGTQLLALQAMDNLEEQLEATRDRLDKAERFIDHMDMPYRYAEWLAGAPFPASGPASSIEGADGAPHGVKESPDSAGPGSSPAGEPAPWTTLHDGVLDHIDRKRGEDSSPAREPS